MIRDEWITYSPLPAESTNTVWQLDDSPVQRSSAFGLRVSDMSMTGAGLDPGDYVIVMKDAAAEPGDIVAVSIGGRTVIRRYFCLAGLIRLEPSNEAYRPIILQDDTPGFFIAGRVVRVFS